MKSDSLCTVQQLIDSKMSEDKSAEHDQELRRRFGAGDEKLNFEENSSIKNNDNLSPVDSENEQRLGSETADSDHVRKNFIDFFSSSLFTGTFLPQIELNVKLFATKQTLLVAITQCSVRCFHLLPCGNSMTYQMKSKHSFDLIVVVRSFVRSQHSLSKSFWSATKRFNLD